VDEDDDDDDPTEDKELRASAEDVGCEFISAE